MKDLYLGNMLGSPPPPFLFFLASSSAVSFCWGLKDGGGGLFTIWNRRVGPSLSLQKQEFHLLLTELVTGLEKFQPKHYYSWC